MKYTTPNQLQQVHLGVPPDGLAPVASYPGDKSLYNEEDRALQATIQRLCPAHLWYKGSHKASCPRPILVTAQHQEQLSRLQNALAVAITNIVERWWTDSDAKFPDRMPLEKQEEDLLKVRTPLWNDERVGYLLTSDIVGRKRSTSLPILLGLVAA